MVFSLNFRGLLVFALVGLPGFSLASEVCDPLPGEVLHLKKDLIKPTRPTALLVVHANRSFHSKPETIAAVEKTIVSFEGLADIFYVHTGKYKKAMYPHCHPTAFYQSHSGNVNIDLTVSDLVLVGGHYLLCLNDTWIGIANGIKAWPEPRDLNIYFVVDAVFDSLPVFTGGHHLIGQETYEKLLHNPAVGMSFNYLRFSQEVSEDLLLKTWRHYFKRRALSEDYAVIGNWQGKTFEIQKGKKTKATINVYYLSSSELLARLSD